MEIDSRTLGEYDGHELLAHVLFEMTFIGFDEDTIRKEMNQINESTAKVREEYAQTENA